MNRFYRGPIKQHAAFWLEFRTLPGRAHFDAFIEFLKEIILEVEKGECTLRNAGYALQPAFYDDDIYKSRESELTFAQDAVEDLIVIGDTDLDEAKRIWSHILNVMGPYL